MDGFRLTTEEIRSLRGLHRRCKDRQLADRIKAVVLLGTGWTVIDTAEALLLDEDTVRSYRQTYQQGEKDLLLTVRYQGSDPKLSPDQSGNWISTCRPPPIFEPRRWWPT